MTDKYIHIEYNSEKQDDLIKPCLAVFPQNFPNVDELNLGFKWGYFTNKDKKIKDDKMLIGQNEKITYESKSRIQNNNSDYVLGIYSKKNKELKFIDIDAIFSLNQKIKRVEETLSKKVEIENIIDTNKSLNNKLQLVKDFGTNKAKSKLANLKTNVINEENISSVSAMKKILEENAKVQEAYVRNNAEEQLEGKIENMREILPPFDLETNEVDCIFNQDSIMSDDELKEQIEYKPYLKIIKSSEKVEEFKNIHNEFTYYSLVYISTLKDKNLAIKKIRLTLFIEYMTRFHLLPRTLRQNPLIMSEQTEIPIKFMNYFIDNFTEVTPNNFDQIHYVKSPLLQLKFIFHILVLSLILHNYSLNIISLGKVLKIDLKQMEQFCRELGCHIDERKIKDNVVIITLKAPLTIKADKYSKK